MISQGTTPLQTRSVDLAGQVADGVLLAEVKSANPENFLNQAEEGIIQLLEYELGFEEEGYRVLRKALIIEFCGDCDMLTFSKRLARKAGVEILLYEGGALWPDRLRGLMEFFGGTR